MYHECPVCERSFNSEHALSQHQDAKDHYEEVNVSDEAEPYCQDCDRYFQSEDNLRSHLRSRIHLGQNMTCPFCAARFTTATGVTHHLERGACPDAAQLNRDELYRFVRSKDTGGRISKKLIGWKGSSQVEATERTWNGRNYECYLCDREFRELQSLNQHLGSAAHQQALYHCPNGGCRRDFKTLAALINHLESEACGFMRFSNVQSSIGGLIRGDRLLGF